MSITNGNKNPAFLELVIIKRPQYMYIHAGGTFPLERSPGAGVRVGGRLMSNNAMTPGFCLTLAIDMESEMVRGYAWECGFVLLLRLTTRA